MANTGWNADLPWGINNWGDLSDATVAPTGLGLTSNLNSVTIDAELNVGWGRLSWGENAWGAGGDVLLSGQQLNIGVGSVTARAGAGADVTGQQQNLSIETPTAFGLAQVFPTGEQLNLSTGIVDPAPDVMLTGIGLTATAGTAEGYNEIGWGRDDWGSEVWGASGFWAFANTTGIQINASVGTVDAKPVTIAEPSGIGLTAEEGTVDPSPDATVVGIGLTAGVALGSVVQGDANVVINNDILPTFTAEADAQLSTAQAKFGPSSLLLDGTGDFVQSTATSVVQNDFTIEFFAYATNFAQDAYLWDNSLSNQGFAFSVTSAGQLRLIQNNTILAQTSSPSLNNNQWNHFALVQNGSLLNLYINGTSKLQYATGGDSYPGQSYKIGTNEGETQFFNGYIDEFRSSDIARYTTTFTPPTSAFTADGNTISLLHFDGVNGSTNIVNSTGSEIPRIALGLGQGQAELDAVTFASTTGQQLNTGVGTAIAGASAEVPLTGNQLTITSGSINVQSWQIVDTGISVTWNDIDTAA